jgi:(E)-4-hydroxy-3-methylbut-2-enyl-diphosphate synthase
MAYCASRFATLRRPAVEVNIGAVGVGGAHPIRIQSMTTSDTQDVAATLRQCIELAEVGCEIVRITAPNVDAARALREIRAGFTAAGFGGIPLVADIHFLPTAAMEAVEHVEKVRVNPGNYADKKKFAVLDYSDAAYAQELERLHETFSPLVKRCRELGRSLRIGTNHGSLSDRIMNRYGDSPLGMVESALEFVRICENHGFHDIVLSMKASNPKVVIQAYRLLVDRMDRAHRPYPLHLGVTEAGDGEDGRIKSAIGIGSLLLDGIGDTIRVSLTEDSVHEIPVAQALAAKAMSRWALPATPAEPDHIDPFVYQRRASVLLRLGTAGAREKAGEGAGGGASVDTSAAAGAAVAQLAAAAPVPLATAAAASEANAAALRAANPGAGVAAGAGQTQRVLVQIPAAARTPAALDSLLARSARTQAENPAEILLLPVATRDELSAAAALAPVAARHRAALALELAPSLRPGELGTCALPAGTLIVRSFAPGEHAALRAYAALARHSGWALAIGIHPSAFAAFAPDLVALGDAQLVFFAPGQPETGADDDSAAQPLATASASSDTRAAATAPATACGPSAGSAGAVHPVGSHRQLSECLRAIGSRAPLWVRACEDTSLGGDRAPLGRLLDASILSGTLLCDGLGDLLSVETEPEFADNLRLAYNILQGAGARLSKTEFVACPSCGRTLFDLQTTTQRIRAATGHLKGVKIAVMGCIVNGPGEMADSDFGYVGGAPGKINLYVGKDAVRFNLPEGEAVARLTDLIREHGKWAEPPQSTPAAPTTPPPATAPTSLPQSTPTPQPPARA